MRSGWNRVTRIVLTRAGALAAGLAIVAAGAPLALAQLPVPNSFGVPASQQLNNPAVSPFLNLAQPGINPGVAYQTLVAPQVQLNNAVTLQQQQIGTLQQTATQARTTTPQLGPGTILQTGHATAFMNTLTYFPQPNLKH
jgi:hypothetical protein